MRVLGSLGLLLLLPLEALAATIAVQWDASPACSTQPCPPAVYRVYRQVDQQAPLLMGSVAVPLQTWADIAPKPGSTQCYTVTAVDASGKESGPSNAACIFLPQPEPVSPNPPMNVRVRID